MRCLPSRAWMAKPGHTMAAQSDCVLHDPRTLSPSSCDHPYGSSNETTFKVRVPLPSEGTAEYRIRASGPALVVGRIGAAQGPVSLPPTLFVLHAEFSDSSSTRFAQVELPLSGEYLVEVIRIFREFNVSAPMSICAHPNDVRAPFFLGRVTVRPQDVSARRETARSLWVASGVRHQWESGATWAYPATFVLTRAQTCHETRPGLQRNASSSLSKKWRMHEWPASAPVDSGTVALPTSPHLAYQWVDGHGRRPTDHAGPPPHVPGLCIVGGSHVGHMCQHFRQCRQIAARFPELDLATSSEVNYEVYNFRHMSHHASAAVLDECRLFILQYGQWDLGYPRGYPTPLKHFEPRLRGAVEWVRQHHPGKPIWMLPTNYVPLNCLNTACPGRDWRTPPMVSAYIQVEWRLCDELGVPCIDTVDVQEPLWDASPDWNHPHEVVLAAMAARVAEVVNGALGKVHE